MSSGRGYAVAFLTDVRMGPEIRTYLEQIESTLEPFEGRWLVHGSSPEILEGEWLGDLVIIEFPSPAEARAWYASTAYREILNLRSDYSDSVALLVEGVPDGSIAPRTRWPNCLPGRSRQDLRSRALLLRVSR